MQPGATWMFGVQRRSVHLSVLIRRHNNSVIVYINGDADMRVPVVVASISVEIHRVVKEDNVARTRALERCDALAFTVFEQLCNRASGRRGQWLVVCLEHGPDEVCRLRDIRLARSQRGGDVMLCVVLFWRRHSRFACRGQRWQSRLFFGWRISWRARCASTSVAFGAISPLFTGVRAVFCGRLVALTLRIGLLLLALSAPMIGLILQHGGAVHVEGLVGALQTTARQQQRERKWPYNHP